MKTIWLSSMGKYEDVVKKMMAQMKTYGLEVKGHFWEDDLERMAWMGPRNELLDSKVVLWGLLASEEDLHNPAFRYGLSLLAVTVQAQRGNQFPIVVIQTQGELVSSDGMTTPLKGVDVLSASNPSLGARLVAECHRTAQEVSSEYRVDVCGNAQIGQWFEAGPRRESWKGVLFGVSGAEIRFHAVGPKGKLPGKSVLNYPVQGLKLRLGAEEYVAWAVQNKLDLETSYYVKVEGFPESVIFGPYSADENADVYVLSLK